MIFETKPELFIVKIKHVRLILSFKIFVEVTSFDSQSTIFNG